MKTTNIFLLLTVLFACEGTAGQVQTSRSRASNRASDLKARLVVQDTTEMINTLNFSPDGESVIVGTQGGATNIENVSAEVLDARTGRLIRTIRYVEVSAATEEAWMEKVAISPDNLMFYGRAGEDFVWDSGSGNLIRKLPKTFTFAAFVPDSKRIYVTTADKLDKKKEVVKVWDLYTRAVVRTLTTADADRTRPSPDGKYLLTRASGKISVWDARTGKIVVAIPDEGYENCEPSPVGLIAVSKGALVKLLDMNTGAELHRFLTENPVKSQVDDRWESNISIGTLRIIDGGRAVMVHGSSGLKIHDVRTGKIIRDISAEAGQLNTDQELIQAIRNVNLRDLRRNQELKISPDAQRIAFANNDLLIVDISNGVRLIDTSTRSDDIETDETEPDEISEIGNTGTFEAVLSGETFRLWALTDDPVITERKGLLAENKNLPTMAEGSHFSDLFFSRNDRFVAAKAEGSRDLWLFDTFSGRLVLATRGTAADDPFDEAESVFAFAAATGTGNTINFVSTADGKSLGQVGITAKLAHFWLDEASDVINIIESNGPSLEIKKINWRTKATLTRRTVTLPFGQFSSSMSDDMSSALLRSKGKMVYIDLLEESRPWTIDRSSEQVVLASSGDYVVTVGNALEVWYVRTRRSRKLRFNIEPSLNQDVEFSDDDERLAVFQTLGENGMGQSHFNLAIFDVGTGRKIAEMWNLSEPDDFSIEGDFVYLNGNIYTFEARWPVTAENGDALVGVGLKKLASTYYLPGDRWLVVDEFNRFDTNDVAGVGREVHWVADDRPLRMLPLEIFTRDYYEPRLLRRILRGDKLPKLPSLAELNRIQPVIEKITVVPHTTNTSLVDVKVKVASVTDQCVRSGKRVECESGVYDLRLYRDGQLVKQSPTPGTMSNVSGGDWRQQLQQWRRVSLVKNNGKAVSAATGLQEITFPNIQLPKRADVSQVEFTAYAFNEDRVKSATSQPVVHPLPQPRPGVQPKAYVLTVGVDVTSAGWRLRFARKGVTEIEGLMQKSLGQQYQIVPVQLLSAYQRNSNELLNLATKRNIQTVLNILSGREVSKADREKIPHQEQLQSATPDDLVVLYIASHGYVDPAGKFYVIPSDIGPPLGVSGELLDRCLKNSEQSSSCDNGRQLLQHSISSEELTQWLEAIDAGQMVLILDSCHSGAVTGPGFKPGPMGDRSFGQLSYDKGMLVLAATQAEQLDTGSLALGNRSLLTYALTQQKAPTQPLDLRQWLSEAENKVPKLYQQFVKSDSTSPSANESDQEPTLFDFSKRKTKPVPLPQLLDPKP